MILPNYPMSPAVPKTRRAAPSVFLHEAPFALP